MKHQPAVNCDADVNPGLWAGFVDEGDGRFGGPPPPSPPFSGDDVADGLFTRVVAQGLRRDCCTEGRRRPACSVRALHPPFSSGPPATIGVHRLPVPPRGDRAGSALVPPLWTLLSRCPRAAGRARS